MDVTGGRRRRWTRAFVVGLLVCMVGSLAVSAGRLTPTAAAGWVWWSSTAVITQNTVLDDRRVSRSFWSSYGRDPNWSTQRY